MKKQNGITLIALIITIIVMLILVGVTINVALNGGLFKTTQLAADGTKKEAEKEQLLAAILAAVGTDGEVDFAKVVLPDNFEKVRDSVYKNKKSGITYAVNKKTLEITEGSGGSSSSEDEDDSILGSYYLILDASVPGKIELKNNNEVMAVDGTEEHQGTYTYDKNSKSGKITLPYEYTDSTTGEVTTEKLEYTFNYIEINDESGNTINSILKITIFESDEESAIFYAKQGITGLAPLTGYVYENGTDTIEFSTSVEDGITRGTYVIKRNGAVLISHEGYYVCYNGEIFWGERKATIASDLSTITLDGIVYTLKQQ